MVERHRAAVRVDERVWRDAVRGFSGHPLSDRAQRPRRLERDGVTLDELRPCQAYAAVYERAHRQLHGGFPT